MSFFNKKHHRRKIHLSETETWTYLIGRSYIVVWSPEPNPHRFLVTAPCYDDDNTYPVRPLEIRRTIEEVLKPQLEGCEAL